MSFTVLFAEDDDFMREEFAHIIKEHLDINIILVSSGNKAIEQLSKTDGAIDCVLSDYQMSDGNGGVLFQFMKENGYNIPFVLFSSMVPENVPEFHSYENFSHFMKPDELDKVLEKLKEIISITP